MFINFGYRPGKPLNPVDLVLSTVLQLAVEFLVDLLCVKVEETEGIPVLEMWRSGSSSCTTRAASTTTDVTPTLKLRRLVYLFHVPCAILVGWYLMNATFRFHVPPECRPYPCTVCVEDGVGVEGLQGEGSAAAIVAFCNNLT